jgi:hypothetical protein
LNKLRKHDLIRKYCGLKANLGRISSKLIEYKATIKWLNSRLKLETKKRTLLEKKLWEHAHYKVTYDDMEERENGTNSNPNNARNMRKNN